MKCFDAKRIILDGDTLPIVYTSTEQYTGFVDLKAGREYDLVVETENNSTGAARMQLFWKTPGHFCQRTDHGSKGKNAGGIFAGGCICGLISGPEKPFRAASG